jgi:hypothetical protein
MEDKKQIKQSPIEKDNGPETEDWATLAQEELEDFIESQGIYIRQ